MAAYASTVTILKTLKYFSESFVLVTGIIDITNYNSTTSKETDIVRYFKTLTKSGYETGIYTLICAPTDNGYLYTFDPSTGKFKAWQSNYAQTTAADGPFIQLSNDVDAGAAFFQAIGIGG